MSTTNDNTTAPTFPCGPDCKSCQPLILAAGELREAQGRLTELLLDCVDLIGLGDKYTDEREDTEQRMLQAIRSAGLSVDLSLHYLEPKKGANDASE